MAGSGKKRLALVVLALLTVVGVWQAGYYFTHFGYSYGQRTGVVRKLSVKGPPGCKYWSGEMVMQGTVPGQPAEVWEFTVDKHEANPLVAQIEADEKKGTAVTLKYRQDRHMWWRICNPLEYFVTEVN